MNTLDDVECLAGLLASYDLPVRIGFEATANCHRPLAHYLGRAGFELKLVSSVALARTREALHNSRDGDDPKDAQVMPHMREIGAVQVFHDPLVTGTGPINEMTILAEAGDLRRFRYPPYTPWSNTVLPTRWPVGECLHSLRGAPSSRG